MMYIHFFIHGGDSIWVKKYILKKCDTKSGYRELCTFLINNILDWFIVFVLNRKS